MLTISQASLRRFALAAKAPRRPPQRDPYLLTRKVQQLLLAGRFDEALDHTRNVASDLNRTTSWNSLVQYTLKKGSVNEAMKLFNEMKKRGQIPSAHTYGFMLKGLADTEPSLLQVETTDKLMEMLLSKSQSAIFNLLHVNTAINVYVRNREMEKARLLLESLPRKPTLTPDAITYTTLLRGLSMSNQKPIGLENDILFGRRFWEDAIARDVKIDNYLANAMGWLLLKSNSEKDWRAVFALSEQVYELSRYDEGLLAHKDYTFMKKLKTPIDIGPEGLSLLLSACLKIKDAPLGQTYWRVIKSSANMTPDLNHFQTMFLLCHCAKNSPGQMAAEYMGQLLKAGLVPNVKSLLYALSSCQKSVQNDANFADAMILLRMVEASKYRNITDDFRVIERMFMIAEKCRDSGAAVEAFDLAEKRHVLEHIPDASSQEQVVSLSRVMNRVLRRLLTDKTVNGQTLDHVKSLKTSIDALLP